MRLLFTTKAFRPSIGGIESVVSLVADELRQQGHEVLIVTQTHGQFELGLIRCPGRFELLEAYRWSDVAFHNEVNWSLQWPQLFIHKPNCFVIHDMRFRKLLHSRRGRLYSKTVLSVTQFAAVSDFLCKLHPNCRLVLPNPVRMPIQTQCVVRDRVVAVGRICREKGFEFLAKVWASMRENERPRLSIVGDGPYLEFLQERFHSTALDSWVTFHGPLGFPEISSLLSCATVVISPTNPQLVHEGFGLVSLEGLAHGCVPVVSDSGALPEAVGSFGYVLPFGDTNKWRDVIVRLHHNSDSRAFLLKDVDKHLERHKVENVGIAYLRVAGEVMGNPKSLWG